MSILVYIIFRLFIALVMVFPHEARIRILGGLIRFGFMMTPKHIKYARRNLALVFPDKDDRFKNDIIKRSCTEYGRLLADLLRMPKVDRRWIEQNADMSELNNAVAGEGACIFITGHLGSFELLQHIFSLTHGGVGYIARRFRPQQIDDWWNRRRGIGGGELIPRDGALRKSLRLLRAGRSVSFVGDQNVVGGQSIFVPFFGRIAATTKLISYSVLETGKKVIVAAMLYEDGKYRIPAEKLDFSSLLSDRDISLEKKKEIITVKVNQALERMILKSPHSWFWVHRRWKTAPPGVPEDFYENL